jgi:hypothetical protein
MRRSLMAAVALVVVAIVLFLVGLLSGRRVV